MRGFAQALGQRTSRSLQRLVTDTLRLCAFRTQTLDLIGLVLVVVAVKERPLGVTLASQNVRCNPIQEPTVVANHERAARKLQQRIFQRSKGFNIQIVRGFVQQQDVTALSQRLRQMKATTLAP